MLIDWFTVAAQLINFLVLVWLLKRFLYRPVLDAIAARDQMVNAQLTDAAARQSSADAERQQFLEKNRLLEQDRSKVLETAARQAAEQAATQLNQARSSAEALMRHQQAQLELQYRQLIGELEQHIRNEAVQISHEALQALAGPALQQAMCADFLQQFAKLGSAESSLLQAALKQTPQLQLATALPLSAEQLAGLEQAIRAAPPLQEQAAPVSIELQTDPALLAGIELHASGYRFEWSLAAYLRRLQQQKGNP